MNSLLSGALGSSSLDINTMRGPKQKLIFRKNANESQIAVASKNLPY